MDAGIAEWRRGSGRKWKSVLALTSNANHIVELTCAALCDPSIFCGQSLQYVLVVHPSGTCLFYNILDELLSSHAGRSFHSWRNDDLLLPHGFLSSLDFAFLVRQLPLLLSEG